MARVSQFDNPLLDVEENDLVSTLLGREGLQQITLNEPIPPPSIPEPPAVPHPPTVPRAGIDW